MFDFIKGLFGGEQVDLKEVKKNGAVIIDVRTPGEFKSGHVKGAINIPVTSIGSNIEKIKKYDKPVITYCKSGMRSGNATSILKSNGIEAYNGGTKQRMENL